MKALPLLTLEDMSLVLRASVESDSIPVIIGPPGVGKTACVNKWANEWFGVPAITLLIHGGEPTDVLGMPTLAGEGDDVVMDNAIPQWVRDAEEAVKKSPVGKVVVFVDEISNASPEHQAPVLTLFQDRVLPNGYAIPKGVRFLSAMNLPEHAANGSMLSPPLANRLLHLNWGMTVTEFLEGYKVCWGADISEDERFVRGRLAAWISENPQEAYNMPVSMADRASAYPTYRSWDNLARILGTPQLFSKIQTRSSQSVIATIAGYVGPGLAPAVAQHLVIELPKISAVLKDPTKFDWHSYKESDVRILLMNIIDTVKPRGNRSTSENMSTKDFTTLTHAILSVLNERPSLSSVVSRKLTDARVMNQHEEVIPGGFPQLEASWPNVAAALRDLDEIENQGELAKSKYDKD